MRIRRPSSFTVFVLGGALAGTAFGDWAFPQIELALGDVVGDVVLGIGGAFFGGVLHELIGFGERKPR